MNTAITIPPSLVLPSAAAIDTWVLLWSQSQNALHLERQNDMLSSNCRAYVANRRMDYVPLQVGTREECEVIAAKVRGTLADRERVMLQHAANDALGLQQNAASAPGKIG